MLDAVLFQLAGIVGAGVLGLPLAFSKAGYLFIIPFIFVSAALMLTARMVEKMLNDFEEPMQLPALISKYLGNNWKIAAYLFIVFSMYGALTAYIKGIIDQTYALIPSTFISNILPFLLTLIGLFAIYKGTLFVEKLGKTSAFLVVLILIFASILNYSTCGIKPLQGGNIKNMFLFASTLFFALFGLNVLPEVNYISKGKAAKVYLFGSSIALILYFLFSHSTYSCLGENIKDVSTISLFEKYTFPISYLFLIFPILAMFGPFFTLALGLRHIYDFDFSLSRLSSTLLVYLPPLFLYELSKFLGISFLGILSIVGEITLPLFAITIVLAYSVRQLSKKEFILELPLILYCFAIYSSFLVYFIYRIIFNLQFI